MAAGSPPVRVRCAVRMWRPGSPPVHRGIERPINWVARALIPERVVRRGVASAGQVPRGRSVRSDAGTTHRPDRPCPAPWVRLEVAPSLLGPATLVASRPETAVAHCPATLVASRPDTAVTHRLEAVAARRSPGHSESRWGSLPVAPGAGTARRSRALRSARRMTRDVASHPRAHTPRHPNRPRVRGPHRGAARVRVHAGGCARPCSVRDSRRLCP